MADTKITGMTAATALVRADLVAVVQDVATTPVNKKATLDVLDPGKVLGGDGTGTTSIAAGPLADASNDNATAVGHDAFAHTSGVAVGKGATTAFWYGVAVGLDADAASQGVAVGRSSTAGIQAVALGQLGNAAARGIAIGDAANTSVAGDNIAIGYQATCASDGGLGDQVAIGREAAAAHQRSVALGRDSVTTARDQVAVGPRHIELRDVTTPATPTVATAARLAVRDNSGTQELVVVFGDGTVKVLADDAA